jgi:hypothetical protein
MHKQSTGREASVAGTRRAAPQVEEAGHARTQRLLHAEHVTANTQVCRARRQDGDHAVLTRAAQTDAHRAAHEQQQHQPAESRARRSSGGASTQEGKLTHNVQAVNARAAEDGPALSVAACTGGQRARVRVRLTTRHAPCVLVFPPPLRPLRAAAQAHAGATPARERRGAPARTSVQQRWAVPNRHARVHLSRLRVRHGARANVPASGASSRRTARCVARVQKKKERRCEHARRARGEKRVYATECAALHATHARAFTLCAAARCRRRPCGWCVFAANARARNLHTR